MCDVVDKLVNKGAQENQIKMIINLRKMDFANDVIARAAEITEQEVKRILEEHNQV